MDQEIKNQLSRIEDRLKDIMYLKAFSMAVEAARAKEKNTWGKVDMDEVRGYVRQLFEMASSYSDE